MKRLASSNLPALVTSEGDTTIASDPDDMADRIVTPAAGAFHARNMHHHRSINIVHQPSVTYVMKYV